MDQDTPPEKVEVKGARTDSIAGIEKRKPRGALLTGNGQIIIGLYRKGRRRRIDTCDFRHSYSRAVERRVLQAFNWCCRTLESC